MTGLLTDEQIANGPSYEADYQAINRAKAKVRPVYPPTPLSLSDINLPEFLMHTVKKKENYF